MLQTTIFTVLFSISLVLHQVIFFFFGFSIFRIVVFKLTPYSSLCIALVSIIQVVFNGCPVTDLNNFLAIRAGIGIEANAFWGGMFGEYTGLGRILFAFISAIFFYYSYITWGKVPVKFDPSRIFKKPATQNYT